MLCSVQFGATCCLVCSSVQRAVQCAARRNVLYSVQFGAMCCTVYSSVQHAMHCSLFIDTRCIPGSCIRVRNMKESMQLRAAGLFPVQRGVFNAIPLYCCN